MSIHLRQQIREAAAGLLDVSPKNWQRVFIQREALARNVMPYLLVYTTDEAALPITIHAPFLIQRSLSLVVQGNVRISNAEEIEKVFDHVALEIEQKLTLALLRAVVAKLTGLVLVNTETAIVVNENDERTHGEVTTIWQAQYHTLEGNPV